jgi:hypothetical protein
MNYRRATFQELYSLSHKIELVNQQSEYFVNNSLSEGGLDSGLKGMPINIPVTERLSDQMPKDGIAESLFGTYFKNNWKVMVTSVIFGVAVVFAIYIIQEENKKRKK